METSLLLPLDATFRRHFEAGDPNTEAKPLERANVTTIQQLFDAVVGGRYDALLEVLADDVRVELFAPPEFPLVRQAVGKEATQAMITHNFAELTDQRPEILSLAAQGDTLMLVARESGRIRSTNQPYDVHFVYNFQLQDGKLARIRQFSTYSSWVNDAEGQPE
ncbi:MAG: nuclear transport factor 2 family protein [Actinomycetota bacterium]